MGYALDVTDFREKPDVLSGITFPDDGSWTDLHYPQYLMVSKMECSAILPWYFPSIVTIWYIPPQTGLYGTSEDLEEAARLDGCNIGQTFLFILAPLTRSSMVALGIFTAVFAYKGLMWPLICNKDVMPLSAALLKMQGTVHQQLSAADGISACMYSDDRTVSDFPETVHRRYCNIW